MRAVLKVFVVVLVIVLLAAVGAAWYFSGLIIDGATVKGATVDYGHEVTAIGPGQITYTVDPDVADPATDTYTLSIAGMTFADGTYLQLQQGATTDGRSVTRPYLLLDGTVPAVGSMGQYDWDSYPDAAALGLTSRDVTYPAPGGATPAIVVDPTAPASGTWVVVVHGRNGSVREGLRATPLYAERGMTTMLINYRDDTKEQGVPYEDGIGNFGHTEWEDLQAAVQYATDAGAENVILVGWSMGGAIVASYLDQGSNTDAVIATQLDSPAVSYHDMTVYGAEQMGLPTGLLAPVVWVAEQFVQLRVNLDFDSIDYLDDATEWPVPAVVTAAEDDDRVPLASVEEFAAALPDGQFEVFDGATHTGEWNRDSAQYNQFVGAWLDQFAPVG